ncbi:NAD(P)-dependent oxidoreductase, partial [Halobellus sp. Atlit-31R]
LAVNLISANDDRYLSLTQTMRAIGYRPRDNSATVVE